MSNVRTWVPRSLTLGAVLLCSAVPAHAVNKDMVQLQTQVQALQDAVARLQQANDERMGVLRDLVQQTADSVNKMSVTVQGLQQQIGAGSQAEGAKLDQVSGQVQSLNDSLDELKARLARMEKSLTDVQSAQQSIGARVDAGTAAGTPTTTAPATSGVPAGFPTDTAPATPVSRSTRGGRTAPPSGFPSDTTTDTGAPASRAASTSGAPPVSDLYQTAVGDYNGAKYRLATAEFQDVTKYYPDDPLAGNAYFYLGEILYKSRDYGPATKQYDKLIEGYPGNTKIPAAQLHKGQALLAIKQTDAGVRELKSLVGRYPNSPEAVTARARLADLGVGAPRR